MLTAIILLPIAETAGEQLFEIQGTTTNNLRAEFLVEREYGASGADWRIEIDLTALTNYPAHSWLKVLDPCGAKLQVWLTNGVELAATGTNAPTTPPTNTSVSNILNTIYRRYRSSQWWPPGIRSATADEQLFLSGFKLRSIFDAPFTNDLILQISPLIYKVDTNGVTANLVEFPPAKLKLKATGKVEEIK